MIAKLVFITANLLSFSLSQSTSNSTTPASDDSSFIDVDTSCYRAHPQIFGANDTILSEDQYYNNTLSYFDQTSQLRGVPSLAEKQTLGISIIKACSTLMHPITALAMQVAIFNNETNEVVYSQNDVAYGQTTLPPDSAQTAQVASDQSQYCQSLKLTNDDQVKSSSITSYRNEIVMLKFTTQKGQVLKIGTDLYGSVTHTVQFNQTNANVIGLSGTLSEIQTGEIKFLSQLGFIVWEEECVSTQVAVAAAATTSFAATAAAIAMGINYFVEQSNGNNTNNSTIQEPVFVEYVDFGCVNSWNQGSYGESNQSLHENHVLNLTQVSSFDHYDTINNLHSANTNVHLQQIKLCGTSSQSLSGMGIIVSVFDKPTKNSKNLNFTLLGDPYSNKYNSSNPNPAYCMVLDMENDDYVVQTNISFAGHEIYKLYFQTEKGKEISFGTAHEDSETHMVNFNSSLNAIVGFKGSVSETKDQKQVLSQLSFLVKSNQCASKVFGSVPITIVGVSIGLLVLTGIICVTIKNIKKSNQKSKTLRPLDTTDYELSKTVDGTVLPDFYMPDKHEIEFDRAKVNSTRNVMERELKIQPIDQELVFNPTASTNETPYLVQNITLLQKKKIISDSGEPEYTVSRLDNTSSQQGRPENSSDNEVGKN